MRSVINCLLYRFIYQMTERMFFDAKSEVSSDLVTPLICRSNKEPVQELVKLLLQCCSDRQFMTDVIFH